LILGNAKLRYKYIPFAFTKLPTTMVPAILKGQFYPRLLFKLPAVYNSVFPARYASWIMLSRVYPLQNLWHRF
jgi:hypothetical protein